MDCRFTTTGLPSNVRVRRWCEALNNAFMSGRISVADEAGFEAELHARYTPGGLLLASTVSGPFQVAHTDRDLAAAPMHGMPANGMIVFACLEGGGTMRQGGTSLDFAAGDIVFRDAGRPSSVSIALPTRAAVVRIPANRSRSGLSGRFPAGPYRLSGDRGIGSVLSHMMRGAAVGLPQLTPSSLTAVESALLDLVEASVERTEGDGPEARWGRVVALVEKRLGDPEFAIADLATAERVSERSIQKLFAARGTSFGRFLLRRRLERCRQDLADPRLAGRTVSTICLDWGFNDFSHFSRSFKLCFGHSPRDFRRIVGAGV